MNSSEVSNLLHTFGRFLEPGRVRVARPAEASAAQIVVEPTSTGEIAEVVRRCERDRLALAAIGAARTLGQLRSAPVAIGLSLARMAKIVDYQPDDMTVVAQAGLTLGRLNQCAAQRGQQLPCDPANPELTTLGALVAAAKTGPMRLREGTPRDLLIGIRFVGHHGRLVHGGGTVVKNVAGYDLMKVMTGSFGTLGVIVETAFKMRPRPENYTLALTSFDAAGEAMAAARRADEAAELIHLEVVSPGLGGQFVGPGRFVVLTGFGGIRPEVDHCRARVSNALRRNTQVLTGADALAGYRRLRDLDFPDSALSAQMAVLPAALEHCLAVCGAEFRAHAVNGVAQLFAPGECATGELRDMLARWRAIAHQAGGHVRVLAARADMKVIIQRFDPVPEPAMGLMRRLKRTFDPLSVFNPGCFVGGL